MNTTSPSSRAVRTSLLLGTVSLTGACALFACGDTGAGGGNPGTGGEAGAATTGGSSSGTGGASAGGTTSEGGQGGAAMGGEGGQGGGQGEDPHAIDDFDGGLDAWTTDGTWTGGGTVSLVADSSGGQAVRLTTASGTCASAAIEQTVSIPADAHTLRVTLSGGGFTDPGGATQSWVSVAYAYADINPPAEPTSTSFCISESYRGTEQVLRFVIRTQGDCGQAPNVELTLDDLRWGPATDDCVPFVSYD